MSNQVRAKFRREGSGCDRSWTAVHVGGYDCVVRAVDVSGAAVSAGGAGLPCLRSRVQVNGRTRLLGLQSATKAVVPWADRGSRRWSLQRPEGLATGAGEGGQGSGVCRLQRSDA